MLSNNEKVINPVDEILPMSKNIMLALQHLLVGVIAAIPVPLIVGGAAGLDAKEMGFLISATLFMAGIATILQSFGVTKYVGAKIPSIMGASFAVVTACVHVITHSENATVGFRTIAGAIMISGLFCLLAAPIWSKLIKFFPLVVVGTIVTVIGLSLLPVAMGWAGNFSPEPARKDVLMALAVILIVILLNKFLKGIWASLSVLFALIIGTIVSSFFGFVSLNAVKDAAYIGFDVPFHFGMPIFDISAIITFLIVMILTMVEVSGSLMGIHRIVGKEIDDKILTKGLRATGIAAILAGPFNTVTTTIFAPNVGLIELSKERSRYITATAGVGLLLVSVFPKISALITSIPFPVLGGAGFAMFGMVAASGIKILSGVDYNENNNTLLVALSIGLSMIPATIPGFYNNFPPLVQTICGGGITVGALTAIILNVIFNEIGVKKKVVKTSSTLEISEGDLNVENL